MTALAVPLSAPRPTSRLSRPLVCFGSLIFIYVISLYGILTRSLGVQGTETSFRLPDGDDSLPTSRTIPFEDDLHRQSEREASLTSSLPLVAHFDKEKPIASYDDRTAATPVVIGYAISVSSCYANSTNVFDGAAVLAHSIHQSSIRNANSTSRYDYSLVAFVHPSVDKSCVSRLEQIGYDLHTRDTPFQIEDIRNENLRKAIGENGCCGEKEFLKLYAYTLQEYPVVVHLDLDTFLLQSLDELFDAMLGIPLLQPLPVMRNATLPEKIDFFFTRDYLAKSTLHKVPSKYAVQGGFLVVRTNATLFQEMIDTILQGAKFARHQGWGADGYAGYWGAAQIQGFLSFFYGTRYPHGAVELNRCIYNTMAKDDPYFADGETCRTGEVTCEDCRVAPLSTIKTAHLTTCWKPWQCPQLPKRQNPHLCHALHQAWFGLRHSLEKEMGLELPDVDSGYNYQRYWGYCEKKDIKVFGKKALYLPIQFPNETTV